MIRVQKDRRKSGMTFYIISALVAVIIVIALVCAISSIEAKAKSEGVITLRDSIREAVVECYAIEGRYPPNVKYLEEHYGVSIDASSYNVFYDGFASNIMPDITVIEKSDDEP